MPTFTGFMLGASSNIPRNSKNDVATAIANPPLRELPPWLRPCAANKGQVPPLVHYGFFYDIEKLVQIAKQNHTAPPNKAEKEYFAVKGLEELVNILGAKYASWSGWMDFACAYGDQREGGFLAFCTNREGRMPPVGVVELAGELVAIDDGKAKWCIDYEDKYWT